MKDDEVTTPFLLEALEAPSVTPEMEDRLASLARRMSRSAGGLVERALVRHLADRGLRDPRGLRRAVLRFRERLAGQAAESDATELVTDELDPREDGECGCGCRETGEEEAFTESTESWSEAEGEDEDSSAAESEDEFAPQFEGEAPMTIGKLKPADLKGTPFRLASKKGGSETVVFVSDAALKVAKPTVMVFIHGLIRNRQGALICGEGQNISLYLLNDRFPLMQKVGASGKPIVLVVPTMPWGNPTVWGPLAKPAGMHEFLEEVRSFLDKVGTGLTTSWPARLDFERVVLAGHSKAYEIFNGLAGRAEEPASTAGHMGKLRHVWSLDATYGNNSWLASLWALWALLLPKVSFTVQFYTGTDTAGEAEWMERKATALKLKNMTFKPFAPREAKAASTRPPRAAVTADSHCEIVKNHFDELLATL